MTSPSSIWVISDVQGCAQSLRHLLQQPALQDPNAHFIFVGDLVNRGPDSAGVLRQIQALGKRAQTVLGNHDLHLLGVAAGQRKCNRSDTLSSVLTAPDADALIHWLRHQPLALHHAGHLIIHAGLHPEWSLQTVLHLAHEVEQTLQSSHWQDHIGLLFGNQPSQWTNDLEPIARQRYTVNALTRLRHFTAKGEIDHQYKGAPKAQLGLTPWFDMENRQIETPVIFGHWSTLGLYMRADVMGIDTGCLWGGQLTAVDLRTRQIVQVANQDGPLRPN